MAEKGDSDSTKLLSFPTLFYSKHSTSPSQIPREYDMEPQLSDWHER